MCFGGSGRPMRERIDAPYASGCCLRMVTHLVFFWVKPEVENARERLFEAARNYLVPIEVVRNFRYGASIPSTRPVVDTTYTMAIAMDFDSLADLDVYQNHPNHVAFLGDIVKPLVERVQVYDFSAEPPFAS